MLNHYKLKYNNKLNLKDRIDINLRQAHTWKFTLGQQHYTGEHTQSKLLETNIIKAVE